MLGMMRSRHETLWMNIDDVTELDGIVTVTGWVISRRYNVSILVKNSRGQDLHTEVTLTDRDDVAEALGGGDFATCSGMVVTFPKDEKDEYLLIITAGPYVRSSTFSLDRFTLEWKYPGPLRMAKSLLWHRPENMMDALKEEGVGGYVKESLFLLKKDRYRYYTWLKKHLPNEVALLTQREEKLTGPLISLIVPAYCTSSRFLHEMVESVQNQTYTNWELCIADGSYPDLSVTTEVTAMAKKDPRSRLKTLDGNRGISGNTNEALAMAKGEWVALMDHDDILAPSALYELVKAVSEDPEIDCMYTDEDKISIDLRTHFAPVFKPDFNREMFLSCNYICHFFVARKAVIDHIGVFDPECDGSQDYDFILRCMYAARKVKHLPRMLYHWRSHPGSTAQASENKAYCYEAGERALQKYADRAEIPVKVYKNVYHGYYHWYYQAMPKEEEPLISIVLWGHISREKCRKTLDSIRSLSSYSHYEVLYGRKAAEKARGEYLLFVKAGAVFRPYSVKNPAIGTFSEKEMGLSGFPYNMLGRLAYADRMTLCHTSPCGMVCGRILDKDDRICYAGARQSTDHGADCLYRGIPVDVVAECMDAIHASQTAAGVAGLMMIKTSLFRQLSGFDPRFEKGMSDIDLSLRLREAGYSVVYDPTVTVRLGGSVPRKPMHFRYPKEAKLVASLHRDILTGSDPTENPHLTYRYGKREMALW